MKSHAALSLAFEKEIQDTSCWWSGDAHQLQNMVLQDWGIRGLIVAISVVSVMFSKDTEVFIRLPGYLRD